MSQNKPIKMIIHRWILFHPKCEIYYHKKIDAEMLTTTTPISTNQTTIPATNLIKKTMTSDVTASNQNTKLNLVIILKIGSTNKKQCTTIEKFTKMK